MSERPPDCQVLIAGGGPAGAALALRLARLGCDVCVAEGQAFPRRHIGVSLAPAAMPVLDQIGVRDRLEATRCCGSESTIVHWAGRTDILPHPPGQAGAQVDRGRFDQILLDEARRAGARLLQPARVVAARRGRSHPWEVEIESGGRSRTVTAGFLAIAAGRRSALGGRRKRLSAPMLARARKRTARIRLKHRPRLVRGDIRALPFPDARFGLVAAPYGILQSLLNERDLTATLKSVARVLAPGGRVATELVADLPSWREYRGQTRLRGWRQGRKAHVTLVESVEQQPARGLTLFHQDFIEKRARAVTRRRFALAFRTISLPQMARRFEKAGLRVTARLGSYDGDPWTRESETWLLVAEKPGR